MEQWGSLRTSHGPEVNSKEMEAKPHARPDIDNLTILRSNGSQKFEV